MARPTDLTAPLAVYRHSDVHLAGRSVCADRKFGPNYVKLRTPLTNIRITTFVCNETEVKVIDPNKSEIIDTFGCSVQEVYV